MEQPERPPPVEEWEQEEDAERDPDVGRVDLLSDGALVAAGELGPDLLVLPGLEHDARAVVDRDAGDLLATVEEAHLPAAGALGVGASGRSPQVPELVLTSSSSSRAGADFWAMSIAAPGSGEIPAAPVLPPIGFSGGTGSPPNGGCEAG